MKCNENKFTDSKLYKASEAELESDAQKCSQNFCLLHHSFYLRFSLCDKFTASGRLPPVEPGPPATLMLLSWVLRAERKGLLFASLF